MSLVKSYSLGSGDIRGDMFYIKHNSQNFTVIDCYLTEKDGRIKEITDEIGRESKGRIQRFISTHPDNDHIAGLEKLNITWPIINFYAVSNDIPQEEGNTSLDTYLFLKKEYNCPIHRGLQRQFLNLKGTTDSGEDYGSSGINFLWPDLNNQQFISAVKAVKAGESPNNICPIITYEAVNSATFMWMGDLETDMQQVFYNQYKNKIPQIDILFAPHHGRKSGEVPADLLKALSPKLIIIGDAPSEHIHYYDTDKTITQNTAGDICFDCRYHKVRIYTKNTINNKPKNLTKETILVPRGWNYCGTLSLGNELCTNIDELKEIDNS